MESLTDFLLERYMPATFSEESYTALFVNAISLEKTTMLIGEQLYSVSLMNVVYMPYDNNTSKSRTIEQKKDYINQTNELLETVLK